jgi:phenylalanine-4-hydroxylase
VLKRGGAPSVAAQGAQPMNTEQKFGEILQRLKVLNRIDRDRVLETMRRSGRRQRFGQVARAMGLVREEHILAALAVQMNLFPGVQWMTLEQILEYLQTADVC